MRVSVSVWGTVATDALPIIHPAISSMATAVFLSVFSFLYSRCGAFCAICVSQGLMMFQPGRMLRRGVTSVCPP